jgi:hypothetical protein
VREEEETVTGEVRRTVLDRLATGEITPEAAVGLLKGK